MCSLEEFGKIIEKIDKNKTNSEFWPNEKKSFEKIQKEYSELKVELSMSQEKFHTCFSL
jgi:hypothetical protein